MGGPSCHTTSSRSAENRPPKGFAAEWSAPGGSRCFHRGGGRKDRTAPHRLAIGAVGEPVDRPCEVPSGDRPSDCLGSALRRSHNSGHRTTRLPTREVRGEILRPWRAVGVQRYRVRGRCLLQCIESGLGYQAQEALGLGDELRCRWDGLWGSVEARMAADLDCGNQNRLAGLLVHRRNGIVQQPATLAESQRLFL